MAESIDDAILEADPDEIGRVEGAGLFDGTFDMVINGIAAQIEYLSGFFTRQTC